MAKAEPLKDRARVTEIIADVMAQSWRGCSVDTLLCHPHDAIKMATAVCRACHRPANEENIAEVCRTALSSRKRGDLRSKRGK